jgi:hypothetical protein
VQRNFLATPPPIKARRFRLGRIDPGSQPVIGRWPRGHRERRRDERSPASPIHQHRLREVACLGVDNHNGRTFRREVLVAPGEQGPQHRPEITATLC